MTMKDQDELDSILSQLSSCRLDIQSSVKRNEIIREAEQLLMLEDDDGDDVIETVASALLGAVNKCHSKHALMRFANIFLQVIVQIIVKTGSGNNVQNQMKKLWIALSQIIVRLSKQRQQHKGNGKNKERLFILEPLFKILDGAIQKQQAEEAQTAVSSLYTCIFNVLSDSDVSTNGVWAVCLSFLTHLSTFMSTSSSSSGTESEGGDLMEYFIQYTLKQKDFPSPSCIYICRPFLQHQLEHQEQESSSSLFSTMGLKLRASPESAFPIIQSILLQLQPKTSNDSNIDVPILAQNLNEGAKLLPLILKQLISNKDHLQSLSSEVLIHLCRHFEQCFMIIMDSLCSIMGSSTGTTVVGVKLSSSAHRLAAYKTLNEIGLSCCKERMIFNKNNITIFNTCFDALLSTLTKEPSTSGRSSSSSVSLASSKEVGTRCLITWMICYIETKQNIDDSTCDKGYQKAIDFLSKPILDLSKKSTSSGNTGNEFRSRIGSLFTNDIIFEEPHNDTIIEEIILNLVSGEKNNGDKILTGLQSIIDSSIKKHGNSSIVPQIDGLIASYIILVSSKTKNDIPQSLRTKVLLPGSLSISTTSSSKSFLYCKAMTDAARSDVIVNSLLHKTIALASRFNASTGDDLSGLVCLKEDAQQPSAASYALACCIASPNVRDVMSTNSNTTALPVLTSTEQILSSAPSSSRASDAISSSLLRHVNTLTYQRDDTAENSKLSKESKESLNDITTFLDKDYYRSKFDVNMKAVRDVSYLLTDSVTDAEHFARVLLLTHYGTTLRTIGKKQRDGLENYTTTLLSKIGDEKFSSSAIVDFLVKFIIHSETKTDESLLYLHTTTDSVYKTALSLIKTLGKIAGNFDEEFCDPDDPESRNYEVAWTLCVKELAPKISQSLATALKDVKSLSSDDVGLYNSIPGVLYVSEHCKSSENDTSRIVKTKKGTEDEEWEKQVKAEIAKKKTIESTGSQSLTEEQKTLLAQQTTERERICHLLDVHFSRGLETIRALCLSDIEIGNSILPTVATNVTEACVSKCVALKTIPSIVDLGFATLCALASCVYEIEEVHTTSLAKALLICHKSGEKDATFSLPSPCPPAALAISEMDDYDDCLSGNSFIFLFPILCAALTGPRSTNGCDAALRVLDRHTELLATHDAITALRKDMASTVLELLSHDRSKMFIDPTPVESLINIYTSDNKFTPSEIAPLLGESGALGTKNCRTVSMTVLGSILSGQPKIIKTNPLVENRIWVNCFSGDKAVKEEAIRAWRLGHQVGDDMDLPTPSKMFSIALNPLLSHKDSDIAKAAADAFAHAMEKHVGTIGKNLTVLFKSYIESYPTATSEVNDEKVPDPPKTGLADKPKTASKTSKSSLTTKKTTKTKKKAIGTSAIAALTTTKKKTTKKSKGGAAITLTSTKKKDKSLDKNMLTAQFESSKKKEKEVEKDNEQKTAIRNGVLRVITASTRCNLQLEAPLLELLVVFLLAYGLADVNESVRVAATNALRDVAASGLAKEATDFLLPLLETCLKTGNVDKSCFQDLPTEKIFGSTAASDNRKEGVVIALGAAAVHLNNDADADKIDETCDMLITALSTPSESVQSSVALCLSKLMKKGRMQERTEPLLTKLMNECLRGKTLASRRGAAYGISAVVKGSGIASLKKFQIVTQLENACSTGSSQEKEGALFAIELLSNRLGLLFEPYVIVLLPSLLQSFSDTSIHVRTAANSSIGLVMSKLSGHGVKLLMPAVLLALESEDWRTKQASIHMLGTMSHCAPKQLASCLPKVVPKLTESFSDTHPKVKASAKDALEEISKVIRNPEISEISSILLHALTDPSNSTSIALESLIETEFLHAIDAASLSLIVPVLHRGLRDRAATTKRYAALIAGNICTMINEPKDFVPYLPMLLPDLKGVLVDPIPDCRSISAKALGSLTRSLGEATFPDLRPWLINTLKSSDGTSVERSGAAQGLTEVICAGGASLVENVMRDEILPLISHPSPAYREGVLWVLTFLPSTLGQAFAPLIESSFPALISGLSDENEPVRDVAMRAGRVTIRSHGKAHVDKILPSLENGLNNEDYRIRAASLNLMGDLLGSIGGSKVSKSDGDTQDDIRQAERAQAQIALVLGPDTRKRVLSSLYLKRSDTTAIVRQSAVQVWKSVVSVTPRTLKEILDTLVGQIVTALASGHPDHTQVAGRCLGDIVSKLGDTVLPEIIPVLRDALYRGDIHTRLGACVGLNEVIGCSSKEQIAKYLEILVKAVKDALCDDLEEVREMAASCFQSLYVVVGDKVLDEVVPALLVGMDDKNSRMKSINGLTSILKIRSKELLPYLIPRLLRQPISANQATALGSICTVTGNSIHLFVSSIIPIFLSQLVALQDADMDEEDKERDEAMRDCLSSLCNSIGTDGVNVLVNEIASKCSSDKAGMRKECCWLFKVFIEERKEKEDFYGQIPVMLRELLYRLNDENDAVLTASNSALSSLSKTVSPEELVEHIEFIRNLIASMVSEARRRKGGVGDGEFLLPGFNRPKGLEPLLPIYQRGILYGSANIREVSAAGLGELVVITANKFLSGPFIIKLTGPLLRIVGDRNPSSVKIAIIKTLGLILTKGGASLRAFVPQFQTTFSKALTDPSRQVRIEAIKALGLLMPLSTRVDPLLKELVSNSLGNGAVSTLESAGLVAVQTATLEALANVLKKGGKKAKLPDSIPSALKAGRTCLFHEDEGVRIGAAKVIASSCELSSEGASEIVAELLQNETNSIEVKHGLISLCRYILSSDVGPILQTEVIEEIKELVVKLIQDDSVLVKEMTVTAGAIVLGVDSDSDACMEFLEGPLLKCMSPKESMEVLKGIAKGLCIAVQLKPGMFTTKIGRSFLEAALENAMSGNQRVQLAYNDFLWLALRVQEGEEGLLQYTEAAMFDKAKKMKSLYSKVLIRIKGVEIED